MKQIDTLIDYDAFVFKAVTSSDRVKRGGSLLPYLDEFIDRLSLMEENMISNFLDDPRYNLKKFLSVKKDGKYHRHYSYPWYKNNRSREEDYYKLEAVAAVKEKLIATGGYVFNPGLEADDLIGIYNSMEEDKCIVISEDKDLATVPGVCLISLAPNFDKGVPVTRYTTQLSSDRFIQYQMWAGDPTDGYGGLYREGEATFKKLETFSWREFSKHYWKTFNSKVAHYKSKFNIDDADKYFAMMYRCAAMLSNKDYYAYDSEGFIIPESVRVLYPFEYEDEWGNHHGVWEETVST